jgi:hypothetical protein
MVASRALSRCLGLGVGDYARRAMARRYDAQASVSKLGHEAADVSPTCETVASCNYA